MHSLLLVHTNQGSVTSSATRGILGYHVVIVCKTRISVLRVSHELGILISGLWRQRSYYLPFPTVSADINVFLFNYDKLISNYWGIGLTQTPTIVYIHFAHGGMINCLFSIHVVKTWHFLAIYVWSWIVFFQRKFRYKMHSGLRKFQHKPDLHT